MKMKNYIFDIGGRPIPFVPITLLYEIFTGCYMSNLYTCRKKIFDQHSFDIINKLSDKNVLLTINCAGYEGWYFANISL